MKKLLLGICIVGILATGVFAEAPQLFMGTHRGDIEGLYSYLVSSFTSTLIISSRTVTGFGSAYTDWAVQNYSTNTYNINISTCSNWRDATTAKPGNYWIVVPGETHSPAGMTRDTSVYCRLDTAGLTAIAVPLYLRIQVIKYKPAQ